jgi:hypothetical protein
MCVACLKFHGYFSRGSLPLWTVMFLYHHMCIISSVSTFAETVCCRCLHYCCGRLLECGI